MLIDRFLDPRLVNLVTPKDYTSQLMKRMHVAFKLVKENLQQTRKHMKIQYDKRAKISNYKVGDKVLLDIRVIKQDQNKKVTAKYEGPYRILDIHNNGTATIKDNNNYTQLVHVNRLKPLFETMLWKDEKMIELHNLDDNKKIRNHQKRINNSTNEEETGQPPFPPSTDDHKFPYQEDSKMTTSRQTGLQLNPHPVHLAQQTRTHHRMSGLMAPTSSDCEIGAN